MSGTLARTPLYGWHASHGGRMVDFAGWSMPVQYSTIVAEHLATRTSAGLFDISHMGRLRFDGPESARYVDSLVTRDVAALPAGGVRYALVTNGAGGILDDVLVYRMHDRSGGEYSLMVVNSSNRAKIMEWIETRPPEGGDVQISDLTHDWGMIALQGPAALELLERLTEAPLSAMKYYSAIETRLGASDAIVSRTGYTGEDGFELIVPTAAVTSIWESLLAAGAGKGVLPAGLGCRDTLRLEAAMPLYGHELSEATDPFTAGLGFAVDLDKAPFPGQAALKLAQQDATRQRRVGLLLEGKRIARQGSRILAGGAVVGQVTSGTFSPTLGQSIAMGYVTPEHARIGAAVQVDIRGQQQSASVTKLPFYRRPAKA